MRSEITFEIVSHGSALWQAVVDLRLRILRAPLGLVFTEEELLAETEEIQIAALQEGALVGAVLLCPQTESRIKMRQVAVDTPSQGQGVGRKMVRFSEEVARERGFSEMVLNARETVVPFYLSLGYTVISDRFIEVTIPHFTMYRLLS